MTSEVYLAKGILMQRTLLSVLGKSYPIEHLIVIREQHKNP